MTANVENKQPHLFQKGKSGNPKGRPLGSRNRASLAVDELMQGQAEKITQRAIQAALDGDMDAIRIVLARVAPPRRGRRFSIELPPADGPHGLANAMTALIGQMAAGQLSPEETQSIASILELAGASYERRELAARLDKLEGRT